MLRKLKKRVKKRALKAEQVKIQMFNDIRRARRSQPQQSDIKPPKSTKDLRVYLYHQHDGNLRLPRIECVTKENQSEISYWAGSTLL